MKNKKTSPEYTQVTGSYKTVPEGVQVNTLNPNDTIEVTVRLRRKRSITKALNATHTITRDEYETTYGAADNDIKAVEQFAAENHLSIIQSSKSRRSVFLKGKVRDLETAFKVYLTNYRDKDGNIYRGRTGHVHIPSDLAKIVQGVYGLDNVPIAKPSFRTMKKPTYFAPASEFKGFTPTEVATAYGYSEKYTGKGQTIGIIELGGGYRLSDLETYFEELKLDTPSIKAISVSGGTNNPSGNPSGADGEVMLDIEVAGSVANGANLVVYFAPDASSKGFIDAITAAVHDTTNKPSVISISWGGPEDPQYSQFLNDMNEALQSAAVLGITVCIASGDNGATDGVDDGHAHVNFPASSPYALACGGTKLVLKGEKIASETVWNETANNEGATGGGVSVYFKLPSYQADAKVPEATNGFKGRGVPDVAGDADPVTGYKVIVDGQTQVIGGTSAVAPLTAAFIAICNEANGGKSLGFVNHTIYDDATTYCRAITTGNNINAGTEIGYKAGTGWNACTGYGVLGIATIPSGNIAIGHHAGKSAVMTAAEEE